MNIKLTEKISKRNFFAFVWHGIFLSLASNFTDVHSVIPALLIKAGGNSILLGLLSAIMMGGSGIMQIVFANNISTKRLKKSSLLLGINIRILALFILGLTIIFSNAFSPNIFIFLIFLLITLFSFSGSYAAISYVDIVGKSILPDKRKKFFSLRQTISSFGIFISAMIVRELLKKYPNNYGMLFIISSFLLFIASLGFWYIKEPELKPKRKESFLSYLSKIFPEIKKNKNLKYYLLIINTIGLVMGFVPFMVLFAKTKIGLSASLIGNILLLKVIGMSLAGFVLIHINYHYKPLLIFSGVLGFLLPIFALLLKDNSTLFQINFVLVGIFISTFSIAKSGVLIEISSNENRAVYTGISGAGYLLPMIFPLFTGIFIKLFGFTYTFILVSSIIFIGILFVSKLSCNNRKN